jgi:hypothetical protein
LRGEQQYLQILPGKYDNGAANFSDLSVHKNPEKRDNIDHVKF